MAKITNEMIHSVYDVAKNIYEGSFSHKEGLDIIETAHEMNRNSAGDYVHNYKCMIEGRRFPRTNNAYATEYYLNRMFQEGGRSRLLNALSALRQHIDYYESVGNGKVRGQREIYNSFSEMASVNEETVYPDEVSENDSELIEGKTRTVNINLYERNPIARAQCIEHYGCECSVCSFDFEKKYGDIGKDFIHVHHLTEISTIASQYSINPIEDLRPVCPNCHAMLHKRKPAYSIEELREYLNKSLQSDALNCKGLANEY